MEKKFNFIVLGLYIFYKVFSFENCFRRFMRLVIMIVVKMVCNGKKNIVNNEWCKYKVRLDF